MLTSTKQLYELTTQCQQVVYAKLLQVRKDLDDLNETADTRELADLCYVLRECESTLKDVRKEVSKTFQKSQAITCANWTMEQMTKMDGQPIQTGYCTAMPSIKMAAKFPTKKGVIGYEKLMEYLKIPVWVWTREIVRPHWPGLVDLCSDLRSQGQQYPPGIDPATEFAQHSVAIRKKSGVTILKS